MHRGRPGLAHMRPQPWHHAAANRRHPGSYRSDRPESKAAHLRVHLQLMLAAPEQLGLLGCQLDEVGGVEGEAHPPGAGQVPCKLELGRDGFVVGQVLQLVLGAPGEEFRGQPASAGLLPEAALNGCGGLGVALCLDAVRSRPSSSSACTCVLDRAKLTECCCA